MTTESYKKAREVAAKELEELLVQQQATEQRILHLRNMITSLDALAGPTKSRTADPPPLTEAILSIFKAAKLGEEFTAKDVRSGLLAMGFKDDDYQNFLASVHVVLQRLKKKGELDSKLSVKGPIFFRKDLLAGL